MYDWVRCPQCGFLHTRNSDGRCPRCGREAGAPAPGGQEPLPTSLVDPDGEPAVQRPPRPAAPSPEPSRPRLSPRSAVACAAAGLLGLLLLAGAVALVRARVGIAGRPGPHPAAPEPPVSPA